jgi:hypothetical protein
MAGFLDNYEGNKERTDRWIATYPQGRLEAHIVEFNAEKGYVLVKAKAWRNQEETEPAGIDYAYGYLAAFNPNMKRWMVEDTTTSALMRVMALVMGGTEKATKETMQQVETMSAKVAKADPKEDYDYWTTKFGDVPSYATAGEAEQSGVPSFGSSMELLAKELGTELVKEAPQCSHGHRVWRTGTSAKTGKDWANYSCVGKKPDQCEPLWYVFTSDGTWKPQV